MAPGQVVDPVQGRLIKVRLLLPRRASDGQAGVLISEGINRGEVEQPFGVALVSDEQASALTRFAPFMLTGLDPLSAQRMTGEIEQKAAF